MNRLTEKRDGLYYDTEECVVSNCSQKLGQLEDIEEELGIDLITLFKALRNGIYHFASDGILIHDYGWLEDNYFYPEPHNKLSCSFRSNYEDELFFFKDYGKTWSIDKKDFMKKENKNDCN